MPVYYRMYTHKLWPSPVCRIKMRKISSMWVCPSRANKYRLYLWKLLEIVFKPSLHACRISSHIERVSSLSRADEVLHLLKWVLRDYVNGLKEYGVARPHYRVVC
jgi:hypothetical protein